MRRTIVASFAVAVLLLSVAGPAAQNALGSAEWVADGVLLYRVDDESLLDPAGPVAIQALRIDPLRNRVEIALAQDKSPARETVVGIAARRQAIAAVNSGFFALGNGAPAGLLKVAGRLIGATRRARGSVGFMQRVGATLLLFDRVTAARGPSTTYATRFGT